MKWTHKSRDPEDMQHVDSEVQCLIEAKRHGHLEPLVGDIGALHVEELVVVAVAVHPEGHVAGADAAVGIAHFVHAVREAQAAQFL